MIGFSDDFVSDSVEDNVVPEPKSEYLLIIFNNIIIDTINRIAIRASIDITINSNVRESEVLFDRHSSP